ncbi:AMP-binding protein [Primorskyibacter aestuariivivens]|uniref:class I adenylate-forming enzyme family protein n=1 Tax=Primorskyibacter aestuariivivens TaxID=1888912 RepID=UPI002301086B|nr:AMP-binding protein [Primorskyibacter aestuariivivens]MDA7427200.1 AMP-binding protein [Primorskyibacter aestuariivivens]
MNLAHWLRRAALHDARRPAIFLGRDRVADYGGFHWRAGQVAARLGARGIGPGDRVAIFSANVPDYLIAFYGIWYAGAAVIPINAKLHGREAAWILDNAQCGLCYATPDEAQALAEAGYDGTVLEIEAACAPGTEVPVDRPVHRDREDLAWLFHTSGTTGRPKGVMITHGMLEAMALSYFTDADEVSPEDATLYAAPMSHGAGIYNVMHVLKGARHVLPPSRGFDPQEILDLAAHHDRIHMFAAPTMVHRLTAHARETGQNGTGVRSIVYAGGPMYLADIEAAVAQFGPVFLQIYGQGECPMAITALTRQDVADRTHPRWRERLASVGRAQSMVEVEIAGTDGALLPPGETGEIVVRGAAVMPGYWQNPTASAETLRDGWLWTGDMGRMDEDGYVTMVDRSKDMIISGGSNIYPREVEEVLLEHPAITEVAVVGRHHDDWGEEVVAFVVLEQGAGADPAELDRHCLDRIARFKRPKAYEFVAELPKNNYGKVLKTALRDRLAQ